MKNVRDKKTLFTLFASVCDLNREYFQRFGKWSNPQIKVFWLEINEKYMKEILNTDKVKQIDKKLFEIVDGDDIYWIDTSDNRIWQIFTLAETNTTDKMIRNVFLNRMGVDRVWITEKYMEYIQHKLGYENRGFGIQYKDILTKEKEDQADFSAKFWVGRDYTDKQDRFLKNAKDTFSISTIRFGKKGSKDSIKLSGELYELFYDGHITVTTCDDIEEFLNVIDFIKEQYKHEILFLESENKKKPSFVEIEFLDSINLDGFNIITNQGIRALKLWLQPYHREDDLIRYSGVDLHTGDFIYLDLSNDLSFVSASKDACMNVAPRFGALTSRFMCTNTRIIYDGVELFA